MDVDRHRRTTGGRQLPHRARSGTAALLAAAVLSLSGCLPDSAGGDLDIQAPGGTHGVPASAQVPPPPPPEPT
jgi:hypothetical protein